MTRDRTLSKRLSYLLRHRPEAAGLTLDAGGWTEVKPVLAALGLDKPALEKLVATNDKQRFELSSDRSRIRARQGHSVQVELEWPQEQPPEFLYHGTIARFLEAIRREGLKPMKRHHVHLSPDARTAAAVGARRGAPVILRVRAAALAATGQPFLLAGNGVWLTERVPPEYLSED